MSIQVIDENKAKFEALVRSIKREGADVEGLLNYLEDCDFYFAPNTSKEGKFAYDGGLCAHSIETYQAMCGMVYASLTEEKDWISIQSKEDWKESVKIVALFHDLYKCNFYEKYQRNVKIYRANGAKIDEDGQRFDWTTKTAYKVMDDNERENFGSSGLKSYFILKRFIPLTEDESVAIINNSLDGNKDTYRELNSLFVSNNLLTYLHCADTLSSFVKEI